MRARARPGSAASTSPRPSSRPAAPTHQYQPLTKRGNDAIGAGFSDDPLWLVVAVAAYVKETGYLGILDEQVPYDNQPGSETSLHEHLRRSLRYTLDRLGPHGLPLIGRADWNDCLNLNCFSTTPGESLQTTENEPGGVAESVFVAGLFVLAAGDLAELAARHGDATEAEGHRAAGRAMAEAVERHGWDGSWFRRAYDHFGGLVGSEQNEEGKIFVEPQGMCILAGLGLDDGRADKALAAVADHLTTPHGIMLVQPAYSPYHLELGEISSYPPGYKENAGPRRPDPRRGQWILGIRPEHDGLRIDPCLPEDWPGFTATRSFRGATYAITVHKREGTRGRVGHLAVDGRRVEGTLAPVAPQGTTVTIEAEIDGRPVWSSLVAEGVGRVDA